VAAIATVGVVSLSLALAAKAADGSSGVLRAWYDWSAIAQLIEAPISQARLTDDEVQLQISAGGRVLYDSSGKDALLLTPGSGARGRGESGELLIAWARNDTGATDPGGGFAYVCRVPRPVAFASLRKLLRTVALVAVVAAVLAALAAWLLSQRMVRPLDALGAAVERIVAGLEKKRRILSLKEREIVAHHEMGHALVALALPGTDPVHKVSIIPRGIGALGYTIQRPTEDRFLMTREELENKMAVLLGGRAAEHVIYGRLSTGAADDLVKATDIARSMVMRYGMEEKLGNLSYQDPPSPFLPTVQPPPARQYSEETAREIDRSVRAISDATFERAVSILTANRAVLEDGARQLLQKETLTEDEIGTIAVTLKRAA